MFEIIQGYIRGIFWKCLGSPNRGQDHKKTTSISVKQAREVADRLLGDMLKEGHDIATTKTGVTFGEYMLSKNYARWSRTTRDAHKEIMANLTNGLSGSLLVM